MQTNADLLRPRNADPAGAVNPLNLLFIAIATVSWLLPTHAVPWSTFQAEMAMAIAMLAPAAGTIWRHKSRWPVDLLSAGFALAATIPLLQAAFGLFKIPSEAPLVSFYLLGFAVTALVASQSDRWAPNELIDSILASLAIAALVSTGLSIVQWLRIDANSVLIAPPIDNRASANVGQANNLATLLVWGVIGIWWAHVRQFVGGLVASVAAAFVLFGVVLTQSRAGLLEVCVVFASALLLRTRVRGVNVRTAAVLFCWFIACSAALAPLTEVVGGDAPRSLVDAESPRVRTTLIKLVLTEIARRPWAGYGWNQNVVAHVELADQFPTHGLAGNAHNLLLDLLVWNGVPLGTLLAAGLTFWFWRAVRHACSERQLFAAIALGAFGVHAMLELPHVLAYFLLPCALFAGVLSSGPRFSSGVSLPRYAVTTLVAILAIVMSFVLVEYLRIEDNLTAARMRAARIAKAPEERDPGIVVLRFLQDTLVTLRTEPRRGMDPTAIDHIRNTLVRFPAVPGLFRFAHIAAINGRADDAAWALRTLCNLHSDDECKHAQTAWGQLQADSNPELRKVSVPWEVSDPVVRK